MKKILAVLLLLTIASCVETTVVASITAANVATREKTIRATGNDILIDAKIDRELIESGFVGLSNSISVATNEGRVLLTGTVSDPENGALANEIAWKVDGVKEVIDEIEINKDAANFKNFGTFFVDSYITSAIKLKLLVKPQIYPSNYKIVTFNRVVYLLGVYKSEEHLQELLKVVSKTSGVKKVVNYVISANDSRRKQQ